jgi:cytoskeletal protein RodZ
MNAAARKHEVLDAPSAGDGSSVDDAAERATDPGTEYATRGARGHRIGRPQLRMVSPLRPERASRGVFALIVTGMLVAGMIVILIINTSLAQGAFTISALQSQEATLSQQEQTLSEVVAASAAPDALEKSARALGMVPSETPVFLNIRNGRVLGRPKAAPGRKAATLKLLTPADATVAEAVDNASVGTDLPAPPGVDTDPAAVDAAALQAAAANKPELANVASSGDSVSADAIAAVAKELVRKDRLSENSLWTSATNIKTTHLSQGDAGLVAVPVR